MTATAVLALIMGLTNYPPALQQATACMVRVLKTVPGVTGAHAGLTKVPMYYLDRPPPYILDRRHPKAPSVQYEWQDSTVTFIAHADPAARSHVFFQATLGGLVSPDAKEPDDMGTRRIIQLWKTQCGVDADALYV